MIAKLSLGELLLLENNMPNVLISRFFTLLYYVILVDSSKFTHVHLHTECVNLT